ncbi:MAG: molybdate ABC transporter substrate-binding protein [Anaerolineaceae bacterium]|nr:molybdate ABC transporter substrate-binding protein [Anaerolineaceae bacterium]
MTRHGLRVNPRLQLTLQIVPAQPGPGARLARRLTMLAISSLFIVLPASRTLAQAPLLVYAAASLADVFLALEAEFERQHPEIDLVLNLASSSTLANQLLLGARADVVASADEAQIARLREAGLVGDAQIFARNRLTLVVPSDNPAGLRAPADLARPGLRLVLASPGVPVRGYSDQVLEQLERQQHVEVEDILANVVSEESNVRQVLFRIAYGSADAGFVYRSDVTPELSDRVAVIPLANEVNVYATYPVAVTANSDNEQLARAFIALLLSPTGQQSLQDHSFIPAILEAPPWHGSPCWLAAPA